MNPISNQVNSALQTTLIQQENIAQNSGIQHAAATEALQGARPSTLSIVGRAVLGVFTLGISEGIRALVNHFRTGDAPEPRVSAAGLPAAQPRADLDNHALRNAIDRNDLPPQYQAAVSEAMDDLRSRFGEQVLPAGASLSDMPDAASVRRELKSFVQQAQGDVTAGALREALAEKAAPYLSRQVLNGRIAAAFERLGERPGAGDIETVKSNLMRAHPQLAEELKNCTDLSSANEKIDSVSHSLDAMADMRQAINRQRETMTNFAVDILAQNTGLSPEAIREKTSFTRLNNAFTRVASNVPAEMSDQAYHDLTEGFFRATQDFIQTKGQLFYTATDIKDFPDSIKAEWQASALSDDSLNNPDLFSDFYDIGSKIDGKALCQALQNPAEFSETEILGLMESIGARVMDACMAHYGPQGWNELGGDGQENARYYTLQTMMAKTEGLMEAFAQQKDLVNNLTELALQQVTDSADRLADGHNEQTAVLYTSAKAARTLLSIAQSVAGQV